MDSVNTIMSNNTNDLCVVCGDFNLLNITWLSTNNHHNMPSNYNDNRLIRFVDAIAFCNLYRYNDIVNSNERILILILSTNNVFLKCLKLNFHWYERIYIIHQLNLKLHLLILKKYNAFNNVHKFNFPVQILL